MFWGVAALVILTVLAVTAAVLYIRPPGQGQAVVFYTNDAASIRRGEDVRIAGITIGKIEDLSIEPNQVKVRAAVDNDALV